MSVHTVQTWIRQQTSRRVTQVNAKEEGKAQDMIRIMEYKVLSTKKMKWTIPNLQCQQRRGTSDQLVRGKTKETRVRALMKHAIGMCRLAAACARRESDATETRRSNAPLKGTRVRWSIGCADCLFTNICPPCSFPPVLTSTRVSPLLWLNGEGGLNDSGNMYLDRNQKISMVSRSLTATISKPAS